MFRLLSMGAVCLLAAWSARADDVYGRIRGTVLDPAGAAVPGAKISAVLTARNSVFVNKTKTAANTVGLSNYWFDPNNFQREAIGQIGNAGRNFFHGPGIFNTDLVLSKHIAVRERIAAELRLEAFNLFNHTQFANPNGDINSANFGRITGTVNGGRRVQLAAKISF